MPCDDCNEKQRELPLYDRYDQLTLSFQLSSNINSQLSNKLFELDQAAWHEAMFNASSQNNSFLGEEIERLRKHIRELEGSSVTPIEPIRSEELVGVLKSIIELAAVIRRKGAATQWEHVESSLTVITDRLREVLIEQDHEARS